jgi:hypothetical protein
MKLDDGSAEILFDSDKQELHSIDTFLIEASILDNLINIWESMLRLNNQKPDYYELLLKRNLENRYNNWQFDLVKGEISLGSGACGEAFMRLLASEIMLDMPEIVSYSLNKINKIGVFYKKHPSNQNDAGKIEVIVPLNIEEKDKFAKFTFKTSLSNLKKRLEIVRQEIKQRRISI